MPNLAHPYWLLLAVPLALAALALYGRRIRSALLFAPLARLPRGQRSWRLAARLAWPAVFLAGLALLIIALARPRQTLALARQSANALAIQMVVDVSGSMEALDFSTRTQRRSRLDAVKENFARFIERRPEDLIGLVTFGGYATSRVPLTLDHAALLHVLRGVAIPRPTLNADGQVDNREELLTAIGDALATAAARLEGSAVKSRVIVLLSDGESNTGLVRPEEAMQAAKTLGIRIYAIGVGSNGRAPFLVRDAFNREAIQWAQVSMDEELLQRLAAATGGEYFNARDPRGLERALAEIDRLEKTPVQRTVHQQHDEWFARPLLAGLVFCLLAASGNLLATRRLL